MRREPYAHNPFAYQRTPRTADTRTLIKLREPLLFRLSRWYVNAEPPERVVGVGAVVCVLALALLGLAGAL